MTEDSKEQNKLLEMQKEVWEKAIDTQMHFNEMSVKSRQLGLSFVVGALGLAVVLLGRSESALVQISIGHWIISVHSAALVVLIAAAGLYAVSRLDLGVYHQMLRGAVKFGEELERSVLREALMKTPHGMTEFISLYSRHQKIERQSDGTFKGTGERLAGDKIAKFYRLTIGSL